MASITAPPNLNVPLPDHTQLPDKDDVPLRNTFEPWQSTLLSETMEPVLARLYPEGNYFIGQDNGIYWEKTDPPMLGCKSPDWYLVLDVPRLLDGIMRRSYVLWQELSPPLIILEYASDGEDEEHDKTPRRGKFWIYERRIRPAYYGILPPDNSAIEMYHLVEDRFQRMAANSQGRFAIPSLGVELGIWHGKYMDYEVPWMRWWDERGNLLLTGMEKAAKLAEKLRSLGVNPDEI